MDGVIEQQVGTVWTPEVQVPVFGFQEMPAQEKASFQGSIVDGWEKQIADHERYFNASIETIKKFFIFNGPDVEKFLRSHRAVVPILQEAVPYMKSSFGETVPLTLDVLSEDGPPQIVYALAMWEGDPEQSRAALKAFDQTWGVANSRKAGGRIVFDYQLV
jgi:hypothetical protein